MLPSTGYFKAINCPFYESGTCDRPYCHFKHSKREDAGITAETAETLESRSTSQPQESKIAVAQSDSDVLQQLVTEAVKKVLANREVTNTDTKFSCRTVVSRVVEGLKPTLTSGSSGTLDVVTTNAAEKRSDASTSMTKPIPCVYNPTPISELKKRHIPIISYMPTRESRVAVKRKCSPDGIKPWLGSVGCDSAESRTTEIKYKPTTINSEIRDGTRSYVPTCKSDAIASNSYEEVNSNEYLLKLREAYYPKCKKRREEYVPKKVKAPLKTVKDLNESTLATFESAFDVANEVSKDGRVSNARSSDEPSRSPLDLEAKFSDDEEDDGSSSDNIEDYDRDINESNDELAEKDKSNRNIENSDYANDVGVSEHFPKSIIDDNCATEEDLNGKIWRDCDDSTRETLKTPRCEKGEIESKLDVDEAVDKNKKECKSKDRSKGKERRIRESSRKSSKERRVSKEKSRSAFRANDKEKSRSRRENKDSKRKKRDKKDRNRDENQGKHRDKRRSRDKSGSRRKSKRDKKDYRESEKYREYESKNSSSGCSRKQERAERRHEESERSKSDRKSDGKAIEESRVRTENSEERNSTDRSVSSLGSIRSNPDDDGDEENDDRRSNIIDNDIVTLSASDSDHDVHEECLKIFQEYQAPKRSKVTSSSESSSICEKEHIEDTGKKRIAHPSAATCISRQPSVNRRLKKSINPQQKMYERWRLMEKAVSTSCNATKDIRRNHVEAASPVTVTKEGVGGGGGGGGGSCNNELKLNGNGRVRIAHVPYAKSLAIEKKKITENASKTMETRITDSCKTTAQTAKSGVRVAHIPQAVPQLIRAKPLEVSTQKFPSNVRQYYVNMMYCICVQIYTNTEVAAQRAVKEEYACHERCKALAVYKSSCMLAMYRLKKEVKQNSSMENIPATTSGSGMVSHEVVLTGKAKGLWSVLKTKRSVTEFRGTVLYSMLRKWILTEQQLRDNGFPRPHPDGQKGRAKIYVTNSRNQSVLSKVPDERICCRCGQTYAIDKQGFALRSQNCIYHWGRKFTIRGEGKYSCCQQYGSATGCCDAKTHVWEYVDYENLRGYVKTLPKDTPVDEQGVYALDCEMSYTTQGLELTRITVIDQDCNVVYETLVKPQNPIIDYNTRFSGITEESMKDVTTTLLDVQATLLTMFSEKTILVGHSLENDFKALRLLHDTVVDTSVMFPHRNGYPQKRALKNLCSEYLRKLIQNDVGGHDSKEDAVACMELILWKAKEEAKLQ